MMALPVAMLFPGLWAKSPSRMIAAAVSSGYFLAASRGLPLGVANFYTADLWSGLLLWMMASASFVLVHSVLWTRHTGNRRTLRYLLAMVLMGLPPFGITGWAHPLTAAGILFPGWGWYGLVATVISIAMISSRYWLAATICLGGLWLWSAATWTDPILPEGWKGVDLEMGQRLGRDPSLRYHHNLITAVRAAAGDEARFVVLPESALGFWTPTIARLWQEGERGSGLTVIAGAAVIDGQGYDNVMVAVGSGGGDILYKERMPVPVSMWQPWRRWRAQGGGARAHLFANPVVRLGMTRIAPLICYEQLILWPLLQSMFHSPTIIVATGNGWWTEGTSIVAIQKASVTAWAKLFDLPVVMAFNM